jgi:hypothetical protein
MADLTRRWFLGSAAAAAGLAGDAGAADNKPDPPLDGEELPTFAPGQASTMRTQRSSVNFVSTRKFVYGRALTPPSESTCGR